MKQVNVTPHTLIERMQNAIATLENWQLSLKLKMYLCKPAIPQLGIYLRGILIYVNMKNSMQIMIAALLTQLSKARKQNNSI